MKGGTEGVREPLGAVICVLPVRPPTIDTYTCGLYVKSLLHTRRTPTISVEERVAPREKARNIFNFREKIFQCGGECPRRKGCVARSGRLCPKNARTLIEFTDLPFGTHARRPAPNARTYAVYCGRSLWLFTSCSDVPDNFLFIYKLFYLFKYKHVKQWREVSRTSGLSNTVLWTVFWLRLIRRKLVKSRSDPLGTHLLQFATDTYHSFTANENDLIEPLLLYYGHLNLDNFWAL